MKTIDMHWINALEKILPGQSLPLNRPFSWTALLGERTAIQLAVQWTWQLDQSYAQDFQLEVESPVAGQFNIYEVRMVPSQLPAYPLYDENYLTTTPGLLPDRLVKIEPAGHCSQVYYPLRLLADQVTVLWFEWTPPADCRLEEVPLEVRLLDTGRQTIATARTRLELVPALLPDQTLRHTEWFHADCLADYYQVPVFSQAHWQQIGNFMQMAADHGVNMILTPLFSPPLDTAVGGQRTPVQLVDVKWQDQTWKFDFRKLKRWVDLARSYGIVYFEMAHLFTQWGASSAPNIWAVGNGRPEHVFGWDTAATGTAYRRFLAEFLPRLTDKLRLWGIADKTYFHVSDEPQLKNLEQYKQARDIIKPYLEGFTIIDALSDYDFYATGVVEKPIPANNHIKPFLDAGVPGLWTYYCCGQALNVSNRFMAMPSQRNRILGIQLYLFNIEGFLHWGYNFYNSQYSKEKINPYAVTDGGGAFPSGDAFLVYPGAGGQPEPSLRLKVLHQALQDLRALQLLEKLTSRDAVVSLISEGLKEPIEFDRYPLDPFWLLDLRNRVNAAIARSCR